MKLTAKSGSRRIDSVNASSGTTVTTPLTASSAFVLPTPAKWFSPTADR
ncbi:MAG TPA: hypothetical protein VD866_07420 [Urbifossiella sp.]|nr:hypothetical protein [Urbifossiella sp.]